MNIIFLTMSSFTSLNVHNIYSDLMEEYIANGHRPYIVVPRENKTGEETELVDMGSYSVLKVAVGDMSNVSVIKKGISTILFSNQFYHAINKYLGDKEFGLILYSTPPITLAGTVKKLKKHIRCKTYLMLKDIFPQNAVDLGMFSKSGILYKYFRYIEKMLYKTSDWIGCMSDANVEYVKKHNPQIKEDKIEICPNAIRPQNVKHDQNVEIRKKYGIPENAIVFMYGGNLGKPQGIPFIIECIDKIKDYRDVFLVVCGSGSEYHRLDDFKRKKDIKNWILIQGLPKNEYDLLLSACDVGLIFLDNRFTIPNFPSRVLSYMEQSMPVLACTDTATDIGKIITEGKFGWWCQSNDSDAFAKLCREIVQKKYELSEYGRNGRKFLEEYYHAEIAFKIIQNHF